MYVSRYIKYPFLLPDFNQNFNLVTNFSKNSNFQFSRKSVRVTWVVPCGQAGRTD
jgi:hypothetical protein